MSGRVYNEDAFDALADIANECIDPIIVTDPPFNIGYHYRIMRNIVGWLPRSATIIDPFAGSGTTCVAAESWGMEWRAIEIDPVYCGIIEERTSR